MSYWEDVATIVRDELGKLRRLKAPAPARDGVHRAVADDVTQVLHRAPRALLRSAVVQELVPLELL